LKDLDQTFKIVPTKNFLHDLFSTTTPNEQTVEKDDSFYRRFFFKPSKIQTVVISYVQPTTTPTGSSCMYTLTNIG